MTDPKTSPPALAGLNAAAVIALEDAFRRQARSVNRTVLATFAALHTIAVRHLDADERRRHRRRCPTCNPRSHRKPLRVDGADYHRRRRARGRRNRR